MIPFFNAHNVTLYHGDARAVLRELERSYVLDGTKFSMRTWRETFQTAAPPQAERLMVDAVITDPPYAIAKGSAFVHGGLPNRPDTVTVDKCEADPFNALVPEGEWIPPAAGMLRPGGYFAMFCNSKRTREVEDVLRACGLTIWQKFYLVNPSPPPSVRACFMSGVQECVIAFKEGGKREWYGGGATPNFYYGIPATRQEISEHPAEKPLAAMVQLIKALTPPGAVVLDPFAGSGTTLRAAQGTGRRAIGVEIEERWCQAIVSRCTKARRSIDEQSVMTF